MRTTDDLYGVKVVAEEARFMDWQVRDAEYAAPANFRRTKRHGFATREALRAFLAELARLVEETAYDLDPIAVSVPAPEGFRPGKEGLHLFARDWMLDVHEFCNVARALPSLDAERVAFAHAMRAFRRAHRWLADDARAGDRIATLDGDSLVYHGLRTSPDGGTRVGVVANMGAAPTSLELGELWPDVSPDVPAGGASDTRLSAGASLAGTTLALAGADGALFVWSAR